MAMQLYVNFTYFSERVCVQCNQTGKMIKSDVQALSREDGQPLSGDNLKKGVQLLLECNKKSYPVTVIKVEDKTINQSGIMIYNNYKFNVLLYYLQK